VYPIVPEPTISILEEAPIYGRGGRLGAVIPANNSVIEPEWWSVLPPDTALHATRILARGDLTVEAVRRMETSVDRAVDELAATGVDVIAYCDMVTTFIMEPGWNEAKVAEISKRTGVPAVSAWTALRDALAALGVRRFVLGTPYPAAIHALAPPFFAARDYELTGHATLDIVKMHDVPKVSPRGLLRFIEQLPRQNADAIVLLATDLPSFSLIAQAEQTFGVALLTSNQTLLWSALRAAGNTAPIPKLGRLLEI
jgi:maleate isomerase